LSEQELSVRLEPSLLSIREARRFVTDVLEVWEIDGEFAIIVGLLTGELVTNALLHAAPPIDLALRRRDGCLRVEVADGADKMPALVEPPRTTGRAGYGLQLVEGLGDAWGAEPKSTGGKTVWFEIARQDLSA
jgi:two-component sensor histidine kinase